MNNVRYDQDLDQPHMRSARTPVLEPKSAVRITAIGGYSLKENPMAFKFVAGIGRVSDQSQIKVRSLAPLGLMGPRA